MNLTLRQLQVFCAIKRHGHVGKAANELGVTQSAASMALAELERQLDQPLFDRLGKRLRLNANGRLLFPKAVDLLVRAEEIGRLLHGSGADRVGELRIGASSTIGNYLMPRLIGLFSESFPKIRIALHVGNSDQVIQELLNYDIDLGYIEGPCSDPDIETSFWRTDELIVFSSPQGAVAAKKRPSKKDLLDSFWILREKGSGTRQIFEQSVHAHLRTLKVRHELGHTEAVKQAVKNDLGISCLSRLTVMEELKAGTLKELRTPLPKLQRNLSRIRHRNRYSTGPMDCFSDFMEHQTWIP